MNTESRQAQLVQLETGAGNGQRVLARSQRFTVERLVGDASDIFEFASGTEAILLLPRVSAKISGSAAADLEGHSVTILARGSYSVQLGHAGEAYILSTDRLDGGASDAINASTYIEPDTRVQPIGDPFTPARALKPVRSYRVEDIAIPPDNGRLRFLQSETMSLNWVEYEGERGRDALSPHSHKSFEQASLAIEGEFIHHLRTPWGRNANLWREDEHVKAPAASLIVIPPEIIHTTEGVGDGRHVLVDIFAPARRDFIAKNWVFNAADYAEPLAVRV